MGNNTIVDMRVKIESEVRDKALEVLKLMGFGQTEAVRAFLAYIAREKRLPSEIFNASPINAEIHANAVEVLAQFGLTEGEAIKAFLAYIAREKSLPLEIFKISDE